MMRRLKTLIMTIALIAGGFGVFPLVSHAETVDDFSLLPPFVNAGVPPLVMLTMARNHKLYYEAYNDISDLDGDGQMDVGYKGYLLDKNGAAHAGFIDYYGYFDSYKCYSYDSSNKIFNPTKVTTNKKCNTGSEAASARTWSGDFLNYVAMSRMDTLRKVLFGGYRSTDSTSATVLERVFIPQDAHTWGKEYGSYLDSNGNTVEEKYNITDFTPLDPPAAGLRHLMASTSLGNNSPPVLRVMPNNAARIWQWVAKERPVADKSLEDLSGGGGVFNGPINNAGEFAGVITQFANASHQEGTGSMNRMEGSGNPYSGLQDNFITVMTGKIRIPTGQGGNYTFAVDGDDAVEVLIDGVVEADFYGTHGPDGSAHMPGSGALSVTAGQELAVEFHHWEQGGGDSYDLYWKGPATGNNWEIVPDAVWPTGVTRTIYNLDIGARPVSAVTDYEVRVKVCDSGMPESNCKQYPNGIYKPAGLLQKHGENESMYFGLMTGSYTKNTSGGVLRKNVGSIKDEINSTTGQFTNVNGIISTINKMKIVGFDYGSHAYDSTAANCGWITTRPIAEGECRMWGNPVGEMMYETLRYFAGKSGPTAAFDYGTSSSYDDNILGLPKPAWVDPYNTTNGFPACAQPFMLVLSDPNNNFDSDQIPGAFSTFGGISGDLTGLDAETYADNIATAESISGNYFIGQSGTTYDGAPTEKPITSLGNIRGLSPEEPTKQGSFYPASVAWYGHTTDLNTVSSDQKVTTFAVALSSPLPRIEVDTDQDGTVDITIVPFAKSVGGASISANAADFQPTNTIVDVFMQELTSTYGKFRINYEDVEQGADHDMDAIATYEYTVNNDGTLTIDVSSDYAAGGIIQHMGYVISGTTADGTYLVVRDVDTGAGSDPDYFLDTPPGEAPGGNWNDSVELPLSSSRTFSVNSSGTAAGILKNPLWYAAKYGGFEEQSDPTDSGYNYPDLQSEWDEGPGAPDGDPDTYFYVTNPLYLEQQLSRSFAEILRRTSSGTAASVISSSRSGEGAIYQSLFYTTLTDTNGKSIDWAGQTHALFIDAYGNMREDTDGDGALSMTDDLIIKFDEINSGGNIQTVIDKYTDNGDGKLTGTELTPTNSNVAVTDVKFVWNTTDWLNEVPDANILTNRSSYIGTTQHRYLFTLIDADDDMVADSGETKAFVDTDSTILPYIHAFPPFDNTLVPTPLATALASATAAQAPVVLADYQTQQRKRVVKFIRGQDQGTYNSSTTPAYTIAPSRSRQIDYDDDGTVETWRLGDIVYSSPTIVGPPVEDYDLLYKDSSYIDFYLKYFNRRNVVYVGANDGMLHAFNAGFYNRSEKRFYKNYFLDTSNNNMPTFDNTTGPDLGAELWGYVPFNLLPHLYWLADNRYDTEKHVAFMDLKPRIFDAKIFTADTTHVNGWGTLMVVGMRFGGGSFQVDTNGDNTRNDASSNPEKTMRSAFVVMDITNPEAPPTVLGELSFADLGFTTAYPTVAVFRDRGDISPAPSPAANEWFLALGSGPFDSTAGGARGDALTDATSDQPAKVYLVDLKELVAGTISVVNSSGSVVTGASAVPFASVDSNSFVSDLITVDYDLDYKPDTIYYGTVSGDFSSGWGGKMRRLLFKDDTLKTNWIGDSVLLDLNNVIGGTQGQPITAAPSVSTSKTNTITDDRWVYFGTGRFFNRNDVNNLSTANDVQSYYGVKEPVDFNSGVPSHNWATVDFADLLDTTTTKVFEDGITAYVDYPNPPKTSFNKLVERMKIQDPAEATNSDPDLRWQAGWRFNLTDTRERNLGQAAVLGEILTFTSYTPSLDACEIEGIGGLFAVYYTTGTAYKNPILGLGTTTVLEDRDGDGTNETTSKEVLRKGQIGRGMSLTPNLHVGRNSGSKAFLQTSTGGIIGFEQDAPGFTKSGVISWKDEN